MRDGGRVYVALGIARRATVFVKVLPFLYTAAYFVCSLAYFVTDEKTQTVLDMMFYTSPLSVISAVILSLIFRLCVWHRIECALPLLPHAAVIYDTFCPLGENSAKAGIAVTGVIFMFSIINAFFVFSRP